MLLEILSGPCGKEMVSAVFMYLSFAFQESKGDVYVNSFHRVASTWECIAIARTGKESVLLLPCLL